MERMKRLARVMRAQRTNLSTNQYIIKSILFLKLQLSLNPSLIYIKSPILSQKFLSVLFLLDVNFPDQNNKQKVFA